MFYGFEKIDTSIVTCLLVTVLFRVDGARSDRVENLWEHWFRQRKTLCESHYSCEESRKLPIVHIAAWQCPRKLDVDHPIGWLDIGSDSHCWIYVRHRYFWRNHTSGKCEHVTLTLNFYLQFFCFIGHLFSLWIGYWSSHCLDNEIFHASHLATGLPDLVASELYFGKRDWRLLQPRKTEGTA